MIERYLDNQIEDIWSNVNMIKTWAKIEKAYINSFYYFNNDKKINITINDLSFLNDFIDNLVIDEDSINQIRAIEKETKHDFVAFLKYIEDKADNSSARWLHYGLTSSDVIDTCNSIRCVKTLDVISNKLTTVILLLKEKIVDKESSTQILARTHGQAAEIQKVKNIYQRWLSFAQRAIDKIVIAKSNVSYGKLSGAVGNYSFNNKEVEKDALSAFNLKPFTNASQIISRDVYLDYFYALLNVMLFVEKVAYDIRIYAISEINEIAEGFSAGQKGSSAMPHKKNPIYTENLCGLATLFKGMFNTSIYNCSTLLERDISHSSAERIIFPDTAHIVAFSLNRLMSVLTDLVINKDNCVNNIEKNRNKLRSQDIMSEMINQGFSRFNSHNISQEEVK